MQPLETKMETMENRMPELKNGRMLKKQFKQFQQSNNILQNESKFLQHRINQLKKEEIGHIKRLDEIKRKSTIIQESKHKMNLQNSIRQKKMQEMQQKQQKIQKDKENSQIIKQNRIQQLQKKKIDNYIQIRSKSQDNEQQKKQYLEMRNYELKQKFRIVKNQENKGRNNIQQYLKLKKLKGGCYYNFDKEINHEAMRQQKLFNEVNSMQAMEKDLVGRIEQTNQMYKEASKDLKEAYNNYRQRKNKTYSSKNWYHVQVHSQTQNCSTKRSSTSVSIQKRNEQQNDDHQGSNDNNHDIRRAYIQLEDSYINGNDTLEDQQTALQQQHQQLRTHDIQQKTVHSQENQQNSVSIQQKVSQDEQKSVQDQSQSQKKIQEQSKDCLAKDDKKWLILDGKQQNRKSQQSFKRKKKDDKARAQTVDKMIQKQIAKKYLIELQQRVISNNDLDIQKYQTQLKKKREKQLKDVYQSHHQKNQQNSQKNINYQKQEQQKSIERLSYKKSLNRLPSQSNIMKQSDQNMKLSRQYSKRKMNDELLQNSYKQSFEQDEMSSIKQSRKDFQSMGQSNLIIERMKQSMEMSESIKIQ